MGKEKEWHQSLLVRGTVIGCGLIIFSIAGYVFFRPPVETETSVAVHPRAPIRKNARMMVALTVRDGEIATRQIESAAVRAGAVIEGRDYRHAVRVLNLTIGSERLENMMDELGNLGKVRMVKKGDVSSGRVSMAITW